jgi:hypothetical protein
LKVPTINKLNDRKTTTVKPNVSVAAEQSNEVPPVTVNASPAVTVEPNGIDFSKAPRTGSALAPRIPSFLTQSKMPETSEREVSGYIGFCSDSSKNYPMQQASGLQNGDIFLSHEGQYIKLGQLEFFLASAESFKTVMDQGGNFLAATRDMTQKEITHKVGQAPRIQERRADNYSNPKLEPHYVCLCIVNVNGRLMPIKGDFRGTKSGGIESAISAVRAAGDAASGWLRLSEAHTATAAFPEPFGRVYHQMRSQYEVAKGSGLPYFRTVGVSGPAKIEQMEMLLNALSDEEFNKNLEEAHRNYLARVQFLDNVINPKTV